MFTPRRFATVSAVFAILLASSVAPRVAHAGLSESVLALAAPLAEQFGVPASAVTKLFESGFSLDSVTQLLLVTQSSKAGLDDVTKLYRESGNDIAKTANKLNVAADAYSPQKVTAAIDTAKTRAQADATKQATDAVGSAMGSALGGLKR